MSVVLSDKEFDVISKFYDHADKLYHHADEMQLVTQYKGEKINYLATLRYKQLTKEILDKKQQESKNVRDGHFKNLVK
ncbi:hypothetical protein [Clostridium intestinale]|uniref:hypothetical protein n=1 Tax=Clostridium intestinale TaxID=36845 RepID=UPI002DD6B276|nr:hypothetical protein [Clostridium intestinale]WRY53142.1 hypothetical protein P8F83_08025 [Clostridium intestinale]